MPNSFNLKTLSGIPLKSLKNQRVLLRADFNVPVGKNGKIGGNEDWRIKAALPTIKYLLKQKAKIILLAHLGRPKVSRKFIKSIKSKVHKVEDLEYSLKPVANRIGELLKSKIKFIDECIGDKARKAADEMKSGEIILLENLRFYKEEEENNEKFAEELAKLGEIYINDAFSDSHRSHASIVGITKYLPSYAGLLMEKEIEMMQAAIKPGHPAVAIIGGAKLETKSPAVIALAKIYDYILVGGMIANEIIKRSRGCSVDSNVILPDKDALLKEEGHDIGLASIKKFTNYFINAKTILWNGPMGMFENSKYQSGTKGILMLIKSAHKKGAIVLVGGGETIYALRKFAPKLMNKKNKGFNISTGGGAMLEFLAGKDLPGIEALKK
ncbi:phosphoglycerate kinase [Patescibacteria group bacterium]|nr:phosphoglycerate kinase [Patescibacteria group bacterium]MBU4580217.1 phosphoglycerate kinase [Patescibacteria group bacterium]